MITLRQLRYFEALARHRHFGKAAEDCAISQPALSMQIKELEQSLGGPLVERRPNEVVLTELGTEVARRAEQLLAGASDLVDFAKHRQKILSGVLRLGVIPTIAPYLLPRVLPAVLKQYPELKLELRETQTSILLDELGRGLLHLLILALPAGDGEIETLALFDDPFLLAVPADDPLPVKSRVGAREVSQRQLILLEEGHCLRDQALAFCSMQSSDTPAGLGATSLSTVMQMVANGYGATLLPRIAVDAGLADRRVKLLRFSDPEPRRSIGLAWRRTSPRKADFLALGQVITRTLGFSPPPTPARKQ
ncbi:MAG TPA: LysR substrate-binding domain-containing protein [Xanthobacteraceae bacterium]|nr:LysR substrate-binding domain-containing protein [Xanthobacteraceae bacterium]